MYLDLKKEFATIASSDVKEFNRYPSNLICAVDSNNLEKENEFLKHRISILNEKLKEQESNGLLKSKIAELESTILDLKNPGEGEL